MSTHPAISISGIHKRYGSVDALNGITLDVAEGSLFGLIGPDGAGKTTLIRILTSLILPDEGSATVLGLDVVRDYKELRKRYGYMPGRFSLYQDLTISENIEFFGTVFGSDMSKAYELIRDIYVQIEPFKDRRAGALSGGMKQKLALCCALIHQPEILFLDEPTTGVDAVSRREFWDMLDRYKAMGLSMFVSTPYMDEASRCDQVAFLKSGSILAIDTPGAMKKYFPKPLWSLKSTRRHELLKALDVAKGIHSAWPFGESVHVALNEGVGMDDIRVSLSGITDLVIEPIEPGIEDVFMELSR
jgi:ABC-type multidrug transport system ATPase subunit